MDEKSQPRPLVSSGDDSISPADAALRERRLRNKIDLHIVPLVALLYLFCFIDRANIGNYSLPYLLPSSLQGLGPRLENNH